MGIVLLVALLFATSHLTSVESMRLGMKGSKVLGMDDNWETQLETGLIALEANCDENYVPFNREKMRDDLKSCFRTVMSQDTSNSSVLLIHKKGSPSQVDIFRHIYIEPICNKVSQSLTCLQPHKRIIESCAREDGKALQQLMRVACQRNGSRLIEFLDSGGFDCVLEHRVSFLNCIAVVSEHKGNLTTSEEVCKYFGESRDCLLETLSKCDQKQPLKIIQSIIEEVVRESKGNCFMTQRPPKNIETKISVSSSAFSVSLNSLLSLLCFSLTHFKTTQFFLF